MDTQEGRTFRAQPAGACHQSTVVGAAVRAEGGHQAGGPASGADCCRRGRQRHRKSRRALFGEEFASYYELCKNRLIFLDGGKDDVFFLEHYVLLGNYARDPDRFEAMDALFQEFLREAGITVADDPAHKEAVEDRKSVV